MNGNGYGRLHGDTPGKREVLRVEGLRKSFGDTVAVNGAGFSLSGGEILALLGPNGAGKTTTIDLTLGLKRPDEGVFEFFGVRRSRVTRDDLSRTGVQLQQTVFFPELAVVEVLKFFRSLYRRGRELGELLELFSLAEQAEKRVKNLSGGQRQRLALACALVNDPELIFLDEPTTGIDTQNRQTLWAIVSGLRAEGRAILLTTHYMEEAERLADRVILMDHGVVKAEGTVPGLKAAYGKATLEEIFLEITGSALRD